MPDPRSSPPISSGDPTGGSSTPHAAVGSSPSTSRAAAAASTTGTATGARSIATAAPGLLAALVAAVAAVAAHGVAPALSPALVAVVLGVSVALSGAGVVRWRPGLAVASRQVLRLGVALLGLQLVLADVLALGWPVLVVVVAVVALGIGGTLLLARWLGVPRDAALLVACGFSICGAAAIAAVEGVRKVRAESVAVAISLVMVFGSVAMVTLPLLARLLGLGQVAAGAWAGAAVEEVGQVAVAGGLLGTTALQVAVVVKLARVLCLAPVLSVLSWRGRAGTRGQRVPVPLFVLGFIALVLLRSLVDLPAAAIGVAATGQQVALAMGMFALGTGLSPAQLRRTSGRLVALAGAATGLVAVIALPAAYLV